MAEESPPPERSHSADEALRRGWRIPHVYEQFEKGIIILLTVAIAVIVVFAMWNLGVQLWDTLFIQQADPTDHKVFQNLFGIILTVIIALEFKRSILVSHHSFGIVQVRAIILIGMLAVIRKLIILDLDTMPPERLGALGFAIVATGIVYWIVREQDRRDRTVEEG